jgi:hypothetical protein
VKLSNRPHNLSTIEFNGRPEHGAPGRSGSGWTRFSLLSPLPAQASATNIDPGLAWDCNCGRDLKNKKGCSVSARVCRSVVKIQVDSMVAQRAEQGDGDFEGFCAKLQDTKSA